MSPHTHPSASFKLEGIDFCYGFKEASRYKFKVEKIFLTRIIFQENLMLKLKLISRETYTKSFRSGDEVFLSFFCFCLQKVKYLSVFRDD